MARYRLFSRDTRSHEWEPGEIILTGEELDTAVRNLFKTAAVAGFEFNGAPVFVLELGSNELLYISFEEV